MRYRRRVSVVIVAALTVQACGSPTEVEPPMLQTDSSSYDLSVDGERLRTDIPYTFTNRTRGTVFLVNCNGAFALILEQYVDGVWELAWGPFINSCLSSPIVIERGAIFTRTLRVSGTLPGGRTLPQFSSDDPSGTYRIVWQDALSSFQSDKFPFGPQISLGARTSNAFELVVK